MTSLAFSPGGKLLASGGMDGTVRIGEATWASIPAVLRGHEREVSSVAFSPDGKLLAVAGYSTIRVVDAGTGKVLVALKTGHHTPIRDLRISPDGKTLVCAGEDIQWWDMATILKSPAED